MPANEDRLRELVGLLGDSTPRDTGLSGSIPQGRWAVLRLEGEFKQEAVLPIAGALAFWTAFDPRNHVLMRATGHRDPQRAATWREVAIANATEALSRIPGSAELLRGELSSADSPRRRAAAVALGALRDRTVVASLIELLGDSDAEVVSAALTALRAITGKSFLFGGRDPEKWRRWWARAT